MRNYCYLSAQSGQQSAAATIPAACKSIAQSAVDGLVSIVEVSASSHQDLQAGRKNR
jgi:hypothetical protein